jgi:hypothetical protein
MPVDTNAIQPIDVGRQRGVDPGDPRGPARALEGVLKTGVDVYSQYKVGKVTAEVDAERQKFLETTAQTDPENNTMDLPTDISSIDLFEDPTQQATDKEVNAFSSKMIKLENAAKSGAIGTTELRIRQEKILREHMNAQPWLADEFVQAAYRSQGYNPIGSEVEAIADQQRAEQASTKGLYDKIINQFASIGVPLAIHDINPQEFFRLGYEMSMEAGALKRLQAQKEMLDARDSIEGHAVEAAINLNMVGDGVHKTVFASLPSLFAGFNKRWDNAVSSGAYASNPEMQKMFEGEKNALLVKYAKGGTAWQELYREVIKAAPNYSVEEFNKTWDGSMGWFVGEMQKAANPAEARAASDFLVSTPMREWLRTHPKEQVSIELMKAAAPFIATNTPVAAAFARDFADTVLPGLLTTVTAGPATTPTNPSPHVSLGAEHAAVGNEKDKNGNIAEAEKERAGVREFGEGLFDQAISNIPAPRKQKAANEGLLTLVVHANSATLAREDGHSTPSPQDRTQTLALVGSQKFLEGAKLAEPRFAEDSRRFLKTHVINLTSDLARTVAKENRASWEHTVNISAFYQGGSVRFGVAPEVEMDSASLAQAEILVHSLNADKTISAFNQAAKAYINVASGFSDDEINAEQRGTTFASILSLSLFNHYPVPAQHGGSKPSPASRPSLTSQPM